MNKRRANKVLIMCLLCLAFITILGCITANITEPLTSFQQCINTSSFIITDYFDKANDFERDVYMNECLFHSEKELLFYEDGRPTKLLNATLSPESIKARADALILIGIYTNRLLELAQNNSPSQFSQNSLELGVNLKKLGETFTELSSSDTNAMLYSGPVSKIIGIIGEMYLRNKRHNAVEDAIEAGCPAINKILNQLQYDLNDVVIPLKKTGLKQKIVEMSVYYNENRSKLSLSRRRTELGRINKVIVEYNMLLNSNPSNLIQEIKQVNNALKKYVNSLRNPKSLVEFISLLDRLNRSVQLFAISAKR